MTNRQLNTLAKIAAEAGFAEIRYEPGSEVESAAIFLPRERYIADKTTILPDSWHIQIEDGAYGAVREITGELEFFPDRRTFKLALADIQ